MQIQITNDGVKGVDAITIFIRSANGSTVNHTCIEGGKTYTITWDKEAGDRYEVVPWKRISPTL